MELVAVAAVAADRAIGLDGELPWPSIPADRAQYRARVADALVILGRRTFESMLDDLPGSVQIVLSSQDYEVPVPSAVHADGVESAIDLARRHGGDVAYVLGGAAVYAAFLPVLDRLVLSRVPGSFDADTYFPRWSTDEWRLEITTEYEGFTLEEWVRSAQADHR